MEKVIFVSDPVKQTMLAGGCAVAGAALMIGSRLLEGAASSNSLAAMLLGLLLLVIGIAAYLRGGKQTITIDPAARNIVVEETNRLGTKSRVIGFGQIADTGIGFVGRTSTYVTFYYIILRLRSGENYTLFGPGRFFQGASDRSLMEQRRQLLEQFLRT